MSVDTGITCRDCGAIWNEKDAQCPACGSIHRYVSVSGKAVVVSTSVAYAHSIVYSKSAVKTINKLDKPTKVRIRDAIMEIPKGDIKPLKGSDGTFRLRVGDWRILFSYPEDDTILIVRIAPRGEAYKGV